jgi:hypothetical protein
MRTVLRHNETFSGRGWLGAWRRTMAAQEWARDLSLLLSVEIRAAVVEQTLTTAEAEQLLARLVLVIDQAITTTHA